MMLDTFSVDECVRLMIDDHQRVAEAVEGARPALESFITALVSRYKNDGRLIYIGAGTSGRLGVLDASECPPTFQSDPAKIVGIIAGGDSALRRSSEGMEDDFNGATAALDALGLTANDTVLGIAAGGTTPYVLGGVKYAKDCGAMTGLLTCATPQGTPHDNAVLIAACDHLIVLDTGPEILTGSTRLKAGSATKLALNIITTTLFVQLGKTYENLMVDLRATNAKLLDRAIRILLTVQPDLSRASAADLLQRANGELKTAIVMARFGMDAENARKRLETSLQNLRAALAENPASKRM